MSTEDTAERADAPGRWTNLRVLWSFVRPHRATLLLGLLLGLAVTSTSLASPMVTKWVLDGLESAEPIAPAVSVLAVSLVAGAGLGLAQWIMLGQQAGCPRGSRRYTDRDRSVLPIFGLCLAVPAAMQLRLGVRPCLAIRARRE